MQWMIHRVAALRNTAEDNDRHILQIPKVAEQSSPVLEKWHQATTTEYLHADTLVAALNKR